MTKAGEKDTVSLVAPPPLIFLGALLLGLVMNALLPEAFLSLGMAQIGIGLVVVIAGFLLGFFALRSMHRAHTSPEPSKPTATIVSDGPYRFSRNPIYLSFTLIYLGFTLAFNSLWCVVFLVAVLVVVDRGVVIREERYLERRFGEQYLQYKTKTRRWI